MAWIVYSVFVSFAAPILIGFWLGNRVQLELAGMLFGALLGLVIMVAVLYITELQIDLYMWKAYSPEMAASEKLGEGWITQAFWRALRTLIISYVFFLMAYLIRVFFRWRAVNIAEGV